MTGLWFQAMNKHSILLLTVLLFSPAVLAECFPNLLPLELPHRWCALCWVAPTMRSDNETPLLLSEIWGYKVESKDEQGLWGSIDVESTSEGFYWYSNKECPACTDIRIRTIDTDLRQSTWAYPACPTEPPLICQ